MLNTPKFGYFLRVWTRQANRTIPSFIWLSMSWFFISLIPQSDLYTEQHVLLPSRRYLKKGHFSNLERSPFARSITLTLLISSLTFFIVLFLSFDGLNEALLVDALFPVLYLNPCFFSQIEHFQMILLLQFIRRAFKTDCLYKFHPYVCIKFLLTRYAGSWPWKFYLVAADPRYRSTVSSTVWFMRYLQKLIRASSHGSKRLLPYHHHAPSRRIKICNLWRITTKLKVSSSQGIITSREQFSIPQVSPAPVLCSSKNSVP